MKNRSLIFICALFAPAFFANQTFGQAVAGSAPKPLSCTNDPLNPIAGKPYNYSASFTPDGGTAFWYATTSTTFIEAGKRKDNIVAKNGGDLVLTASNYNTSLGGVTSPSSSSITWNSDSLSKITPTSPLFVVVQYTGTCNNNMKVYNIIPKNGFTVDIRSMESDLSKSVDYDKTTEQCAANIAGATYDGTKMNMDYGTQTLYFEVVAANFSKSFTPSFKITGLADGTGGIAGTQTAKIYWGYTPTTITTPITAASADITNATPVTSDTPAVTNVTDTSNGVSIYVKVVIENKNFENLGGQTIALAVDAKNSSNQDDVLETDCSTNTAFADIAQQLIKVRPTVTSGTTVTGGGTGTFIPQN